MGVTARRLMQAIRVHDGGGVVFEHVPDPVPAPGEVLVELRCAALNRRDLLVRGGVYPFPLPLVPGSDGAGVRRDTGEDVVILPSLHWGATEAAPGPEFQILGGPRDGTFAELIAIPKENVYPRPSGFSWQEAAAFPLAALTAWRALFTRGRLIKDETVLILGAGSGVSTFAVQLAAHEGARVLVTSSSQEKIDRAIALGAEAGVLYSEENWAAAVKDLTGGSGVDVVLDSVGSTWGESLQTLRPGGRLVVFGATGGTEAQLQVRPFYLQQQSLLGTTMGSPPDFAALLRVLHQVTIRAVIDTVFPLADAGTALDRMESGGHFGKLVLTCS